MAAAIEAFEGDSDDERDHAEMSILLEDDISAENELFLR
jgi:hypothetical protein